MTTAVPPAGSVPERYTARRYFALVDEGVLAPDDKVELLEGVIVTMAPEGPRHAAATTRVREALVSAVRGRAVVREAKPFLASEFSVPEPDVAVVPGTLDDYDDRHPVAALLAVECSDSSLAQDRITKQGIYAAAGIPEYWIVNLRDDCVEVARRPDAIARAYGERRVATRGDVIELLALPGARVEVDDLLPRRPD